MMQCESSPLQKSNRFLSVLPFICFAHIAAYLSLRALYSHYLFTTARRGTDLKSREKKPSHGGIDKDQSWPHTQSLRKVQLLFYLPYSTCFRQSAPTRLEWILSRPFRFSSSNVLMKGDGTIWSDPLAASSAQLRARHTPAWYGKLVDRPLIYPLPFSLIPCRPLVCELVHPCARTRTFICLCWLSTYRIVYDRPNWANWGH